MLEQPTAQSENWIRRTAKRVAVTVFGDIDSAYDYPARVLLGIIPIPMAVALTAALSPTPNTLSEIITYQSHLILKVAENMTFAAEYITLPWVIIQSASAAIRQHIYFQRGRNQ